ncbi:hypothetical protein [Nitrospirillum amazonense]|uniref:Cysteine rich repeat protein n=1 Tax=Nitrospirillum amazonense TaxID=28077 RepID=A0A560J402_9PROT|nr:hypothetical protein [Nitrospirillum amazonense]MDG3439099.1 hypothetical protein [Nitrospirillum amazonense]TWB65972.1 hypothetical protein FBZ87_11767 [Nitrospirillum amazonense]
MKKNYLAAIATINALCFEPAFAMAADTPQEVTVHPSIDRACREALNVGPNDSVYAACVASLRETLTATKKVHNEHCQTACSEAGLKPGSEAFDRCVANLSGALAQAQLNVN